MSLHINLKNGYMAISQSAEKNTAKALHAGRVPGLVMSLRLKLDSDFKSETGEGENGEGYIYHAGVIA